MLLRMVLAERDRSAEKRASQGMKLWRTTEGLELVGMTVPGQELGCPLVCKLGSALGVELGMLLRLVLPSSHSLAAKGASQGMKLWRTTEDL